MELAGLKVVMDADFSAVENAFAQANAMASQFAANVKNAFDNIGGGKFKFDTGASQAAQDAKAYAQAAREQAKATLDAAKAKDIEERAVQRVNAVRNREKDLYGQLVAESQELVRSYYNAAAAIIKNGDAAGITAEKLEEMRIAALNGQTQLRGIEAGAGRFQRGVGDYSGALNGLRISAQYLSGEIPNFFQSLQIGLRSVTNNIQPLILNLQALRQENERLAASGKPTINAFKAVAGAFLNWQTALLVGIGLLAKYGPELYKMATGGTAAADAVKKFGENQKELTQAFESGLTSAARNISSIKGLNTTITSGNIPMEARIKAYKEAEKLYPSYLGHISQESALNGGLSKVINDQLVPALLSAAKARGFENQLTKLTEQEIILRQSLSQAIKDQAKEGAKLMATNERLAASGNKPGPLASGALEGNYDRAAIAVKKYRDEIIKNLGAQKEIGGEFEKQLQLNDKLDTSGKDYGTYKEKAVKNVRTVTDALQDLIVKNKEADLELSTGAATIEQTLQKKLSNYRSYITEVTKQSKFTISFDDSRVASAQNQIESLSKSLVDLKSNDEIDKILQSANASISDIQSNELDGTITKLESLTQQLNIAKQAKRNLVKNDEGGISDSFISYYSDQIKELTVQLNSAKIEESARKMAESFSLIDREVSTGFIKNSDGISEKISLIRQEMKSLIDVNQQGSESFKNLQKQLDSLNLEKVSDTIDQFKKSISETLTKSFETLGESLGNMFSGGKFDFIGGILNLLGSQLKKLGEYLIEVGIAREAIGVALKTLNFTGVGAIAAGVAAVALGQILQNAAQKRTETGFADGGVVYGPTRALVGEYAGARGNPEVIAPLSKLTSILRQQNIGNMRPVPVVLNTRIQGSDLLLVQERATRAKNR